MESCLQFLVLAEGGGRGTRAPPAERREALGGRRGPHRRPSPGEEEQAEEIPERRAPEESYICKNTPTCFWVFYLDVFLDVFLDAFLESKTVIEWREQRNSYKMELWCRMFTQFVNYKAIIS